MSKFGKIKVIDLLAAADAAPLEHKKFSQLVRRLKDANSAHTDLATAHDMITMAEDIRLQGETSNRFFDRGVMALIYSAVVLYARATKTQSRHRGTLDLRRMFTDSERLVHEEICLLRDDAIAHFGPGKSDDAPTWHEEAVFIPLDRPDDYRIVPVSIRMVFSDEWLRRLSRQIHRAMILSLRVLRKRDEQVVEALHDTFDSDDSFAEFLNKFVVNADEFFGSADRAARVLAGDRVGRLTTFEFGDEVIK